ncbi:MAG: acetyl-CoA carboxylase carboxyltransferase subunit beta [Verrucomicrobia bacterium]|nr:MAG: acetyl-CoA carboxylase carboxyltransferase subunit beta [Verrucomicrobiota bacterium]
MPTKVIKKKHIVTDPVEPSLTPPNATDTTFLQKPRIGGKSKKRDIPEGLWTKCPKCEGLIYDRELDDNLKVCPKCEHHLPIGARERLNALVETCSFEEIDSQMESVDVLKFTGVASYEAKLAAYKKKSSLLKDAVVTGIGRIGNHRVALGVMDFGFLGGSMGSVVGEKLTRLIEAATDRGLPVIVFSTSGGARMYEGMFSLMQMAKTCGALAYHGRQHLPYISVLVNPCYAGVMASYASVGDLILAEPGALIGFAGPRVIRDTTQADLPEGFQTAEFLQKHGLIDAIVSRITMRARLIYYLDFLMHGREAKSA